ncbi:MAG: PIG-L family deacetylase [Paraclostridium sp.]
MDKLLKKIEIKFRCINRKVIKKIYYIKNHSLSNPRIKIDNINKILFIAHPDDEILFFYEQLTNESGWLVICMTNGDNPVRLREFIKSMENMKLQYQIWDFEDGLYSIWNEDRVKKKVKKILSLKSNFEKIITHNEEGEYGHLQHKQLNKYINQVYKGKNFYTSGKVCFLHKNENKLDKKDLEMKKHLINECYSSQNFILEEFSVYTEYESITRIR